MHHLAGKHVSRFTGCMSWQCVLADQEVNCILGCIRSSTVSRKEEVILLCSYEIPARVLHPVLGPQFKKDVKLWK